MVVMWAEGVRPGVTSYPRCHPFQSPPLASDQVAYFRLEGMDEIKPDPSGEPSGTHLPDTGDRGGRRWGGANRLYLAPLPDGVGHIALGPLAR